ALHDKAAADDEDQPIGNVRVSREYNLIVDPEDVVPAGNYGSDGLTDRLHSPQTATSQHADEEIFAFDRTRFTQCSYESKQLGVIEPDLDAQKAFTHWLRFAGNPTDDKKPEAILSDQREKDFFNTLWRRKGPGGGRVACRFALQTVMKVW